MSVVAKNRLPTPECRFFSEDWLALDYNHAPPGFDMTLPSNIPHSNRQIYKVVLTGGPCGGKTTGQSRLASFFEALGWKVYRVPEAATILLGGGVKFAELNDQATFDFQEDLLKTMLQIENTFFRLAENCERDCLVICDRGTMDPSAYIEPEGWNTILEKNNLNSVDLRDNRYNQVVHMVTAANGAERFYQLANNNTRTESINAAIATDERTKHAWVGHPYFDVVDNRNCRNFDDKILTMIQLVCDKAKVEYGDRLGLHSRKRKWLVDSFDDSLFPPYQQFDVEHNYLVTSEPNLQMRIRKRGQNGFWSYLLTMRKDYHGFPVETRKQLDKTAYEYYYNLRDRNRATIYKKRRCFSYDQQYFQLDIYSSSSPPQKPATLPVSSTLLMLETYTTRDDDVTAPLSPFLRIEREVTGVAEFSMYTMSRLLPPSSAVGDGQQPITVNGISADATKR